MYELFSRATVIAFYVLTFTDIISATLENQNMEGFLEQNGWSEIFVTESLLYNSPYIV